MSMMRSSALTLLCLALTSCAASAGVRPVATTVPMPASRLDSLADCASIHPQKFDPDPDPALDCRLRATDSSGLTFEVLGTPPETIKVFGPNETLRQTITQPVNHPQRNTPFLADMDHDGRQELIVITSAGGTGGDGMAVWRANKQTGKFAAAGEVFGFTNFRTTDEGFIAIYAHAGAGAGDLNIFRFVDDKLVQLATLEVQTADWSDPTPAPDWTVNGNTKCALYQDDDSTKVAAQNKALTDAGIDPATAQDHFCNQPWVGSIYGQH